MLPAPGLKEQFWFLNYREDQLNEVKDWCA